MLTIIPNRNDKIIIDACIIMVGIDENDYSLDHIRKIFLNSFFEYFDKILIHDVVYNNELDKISKKWISEQIKLGKVEIVYDPEKLLNMTNYYPNLKTMNYSSHL